MVRGELEAFAAEVFEPFARKDQRRWGQVYLRGLLTDGQRKSVEPMATRLGEDGNRQALANFITTSPWDPAHIRAQLAWRMEEAIGPDALVFDDTGFLKDGTASACVSRQYTGTAGKVTNCQVGVSLHLACDRASAAVNWRLFLPQAWDPASPKADPGPQDRPAADLQDAPTPRPSPGTPPVTSTPSPRRRAPAPPRAPPATSTTPRALPCRGEAAGQDTDGAVSGSAERDQTRAPVGLDDGAGEVGIGGGQGHHLGDLLCRGDVADRQSGGRLCEVLALGVFW